MVEVVPAIIAKDFHELVEKIRLMEPYVNWVQLDVMDGKFASEKTWNEPMELKNLDIGVNMEVHLMVSDPEAEVGRWLDSGVRRILVHYETLGNQESGIRNWELILKKCKENNVELGLALNLETPIDVLDKFQVRTSSSQARASFKFQVIQLMSIAQIGYHGHPFDEKVIHKIKSLRKKYPDVKIAVDGGINEDTARKAIEAGADILAVGSAIFNSENIGETIQRIKEIHV